MRLIHSSAFFSGALLLISMLGVLPCAQGGQDLVQNGTFLGQPGGNFPREWERIGSGKLEWKMSDKTGMLVFTADPPSEMAGARQTLRLPQPIPAAVEVSARVKLDGVKRGEKNWYSGRILLTYLDGEDHEIGEAFTLDRLEGDSDWKNIHRQFPVPPGAVQARLELQLFHAAAGSLCFENIALKAQDAQEAQAWRKAADERIEKYRKAPLRISVKDAAGHPVPDAEVTILMRRQAYPFGTAVRLRSLIAPPGDENLDTYRSVVENFFNYATPENELKAPHVEKNGLAEALAGLSWLKNHQIRIRGHVLTWPSFEMSSKAVNAAKDDPEALREIMRKHFHDLLTATEPYDIADWDVVNEPSFHNDLIRILGESQVSEWYRWASKDAPHARLFLNENNVEFHNGNQGNMERWIQLLQREGAPLGGLGWQGHMWHRTLPSGQNILDDLDYFSRYGLPIQITEYDTNERFSEEDSARFLDEFLTAWFSHPSTAGFIMWGFQDSYIWNGNGPLFRKDWSLKPSGKVWMDLVFKRWWTEVRGKCTPEGSFETRAFLGNYDIEARQNGRSVVRNVDLGPAGLDVTLTLGDTDLPAIVSSNPYTTGKLPKVIPLKSAPSGFMVRTVMLNHGNGTAALVPPATVVPTSSGLDELKADANALTRHDLYLRFDLEELKAVQIDKAALQFTLGAPLDLPARVDFYVLSHRFVPQGKEAGLDWQPDKMALGYAPGRSANDGEYRLGDAAVIYLGERTFEKATMGARLSFSSPELARAVQASGGKSLTIILAPVANQLPVAMPAHSSSSSPSLEVQVPRQP